VTAKTPERLRREAAHECAEQLAVVAAECTWDQAESWLRIHMTDARFDLIELALVLASMTESDKAYREEIAARNYPIVKPA
jgi:hypothetical protein